MPQFSREDLYNDVVGMVTGDIDTNEFVLMANKTVIDVLSDVDIRSMKRKSELTPGLFDEVYDYTCPVSLKGQAIIDIRPQVNRGKLNQWRLTTDEEFDRVKSEENGVVAISNEDFVKKIRLSEIATGTSTTIDTLTTVNEWEAFGDVENIERDSSNFVKGSSSLSFDINSDGGTTAGIVNDSLDSFDISDYLTNGSFFVWHYIADSSDITNYILRVGSDSLNYYYITVTTTNEGVSFYNGWNLLRFDMADKETTGTPDDENCEYVAIYMTKEATKTDEKDYRFNHLVLSIGDHYNLVYYSKYGWQDDDGTYLEKSTDDTDYLNVDTNEFNLISTKCSENIERYILKNQDEADIRKREYDEKKGEYLKNNPSEALLLTSTYYFDS